jgi:dipeptidyl-peptidase-3
MNANVKLLIAFLFLPTLFISCNNSTDSTNQTGATVKDSTVAGDSYDPNFTVEAESFADLQILRYQVPGFSGLSLQQKQLAYYLYEAALSGRDIIYDQKSKYGIMLRKTLEAGYGSFKGDKNTDDWKKFQEYCGRVWFSNGNHHHYANE